jgi:cyclohexyl-isocyanide hydratase
VVPHDTHLQIGALIFDGMDQMDLTGPFEVLSRVPNSTYQIYAKTDAPVRDLNGLRLIPNATLAAAPPLDVLHVPGGLGQEALMEWITRTRSVFDSGASEAVVSGDHRAAGGDGPTDRHSFRHLCPDMIRLAKTEGILAIRPKYLALHCLPS